MLQFVTMSAAENKRDNSSNQESQSKTQGNIYKVFCRLIDCILNAAVQNSQLNILITFIQDNNKLSI